MLVSTALYVLVCKTSGFTRYQLLVPAVTMFTIATVNVGLSMYTLFGLLISGTRLPQSLVQAKYMFHLFNK